MAVAHLTFQLGLGDECGDGVDDDQVDRIRADEDFGDLECLLAAVGLGNEKVIDIDAEFLCVFGVERMFSINERRQSADLLSLGDYVQR